MTRLDLRRASAAQAAKEACRIQDPRLCGRFSVCGIPCPRRPSLSECCKRLRMSESVAFSQRSFVFLENVKALLSQKEEMQRVMHFILQAETAAARGAWECNLLGGLPTTRPGAALGNGPHAQPRTSSHVPSDGRQVHVQLAALRTV